MDLGGSIHKFVGTVLGTEEFGVTNISLIPNPAYEQVSISIENDRVASVQLINVLGEVILDNNDRPSSHRTIELSGISGGLYLVQIQTENGETIVKKIVIK